MFCRIRVNHAEGYNDQGIDSGAFLTSDDPVGSGMGWCASVILHVLLMSALEFTDTLDPDARHLSLDFLDLSGPAQSDSAYSALD